MGLSEEVASSSEKVSIISVICLFSIVHLVTGVYTFDFVLIQCQYYFSFTIPILVPISKKPKENEIVKGDQIFYST